MAEGEAESMVEAFDRELEDLVTRYHAMGLDPGKVLSRLAWQLCDVAAGCSIRRGQFFDSLRASWELVQNDWKRRRAGGGVFVAQPRVRGEG